MARRPLRCLAEVCGLVVCLATASDTRAQESVVPSVGLWAAAALVPAGLDPRCGFQRSGSSMPNVGASLVVPTGPIALEARLGAHLSGGSQICELELPHLLQVGTRTERVPVLGPGNFTSFDVRVRWVPMPDAAAVQIAAGGGWTGGTKNVPYLNASVGGRLPADALRLGIDVELTAYKLPWIERTIEVNQDLEQTELLVRRFEEWAPAIGIRCSIEIPFGR